MTGTGGEEKRVGLAGLCRGPSHPSEQQVSSRSARHAGANRAQTRAGGVSRSENASGPRVSGHADRTVSRAIASWIQPLGILSVVSENSKLYAASTWLPPSPPALDLESPHHCFPADGPEVSVWRCKPGHENGIGLSAQ